MRNSFLLLALFFVFTLIPITAHSQVINTDSPYSRFGFGLIERQAYPQTLGFGGLVHGISQKHSMNPFNPASYPAQDTMTFLFDVALQAGYSHNTLPGGKKQDKGFANMQHIGFQVPIKKWGGIAVGFQPYSQLGYNITRFEQDPELISQIGRVRYHHKGSGGINEAFLGFGARPHRFISIGLNMHYRFGSINHTQNLYIPNNMLYSELSFDRRYVIRELRLRAGVQGYIPCDTVNIKRVVVGATVEYSPIVYAENRIEATSTYLNAELSVYQNKLIGSTKMQIPLKYGLGAVYESNIIMAGLDLFYEGWREFNLFDIQQKMHSAWEVRAGVQLTPDASNLRHYYKRMQYRLGVYYSQLPMVIDEESIHDTAVTLGLGFPFGYRRSIFNLGLMIGHRGNFGKDIVSELYCNLQLGVSFTDIWFFKRKYD